MNREIVVRRAASERNRLLEGWVALQFVALAVFLAFVVGTTTTPAVSSEKPGATADRLRVRDLVVVDAQGVERVRISGDFGDEARRGQKGAGLLLYDGAGRERGGYMTWEPSGHVGLTLDTGKGQVTLFVAARDSGSALTLWHGQDVVELRSDDDGSRLTAVKEGRVAFQQPPVTPGTEACTAYREARARLPREEVLRECRRRFTQTACRKCLIR